MALAFFFCRKEEKRSETSMSTERVFEDVKDTSQATNRGRLTAEQQSIMGEAFGGRLTAEQQSIMGEAFAPAGAMAMAIPLHSIYRDQERRDKFLWILLCIICLGLGVGGVFFVRHMYRK